MFTIVLTFDGETMSGRIEDADISAQNCVGTFEARAEAVAFMNAMPELA